MKYEIKYSNTAFQSTYDGSTSFPQWSFVSAGPLSLSQDVRCNLKNVGELVNGNLDCNDKIILIF